MLTTIILKVIISSVIFLVFPVGWALGANDFSTNYKVTYDLSADSPSLITFKIGITNLSNQTYVSEYTLNVEGEKISKIQSFDGSGHDLNPTVAFANGATQIRTIFQNKVVGANATQEWTTTFESEDVAQKNGRIWNISLPKPRSSEAVNRYEVEVLIPVEFGGEIYSSPVPTSILKNGSTRIYSFLENSIKETGALLSFGDYQLYHFNLKYSLKNPNLFSSLVKFALPPNILGEQEITLTKIFPSPIEVKEDEDGNLLAFYRLNNSKTNVVEVEGTARVLHPRRNFQSSGSFAEIPKNLQDSYLESQLYWETDDEQIKTVVRDRVDRSRPVSENARRLYDYAVSELTYNKNRINDSLVRFGARKALAEKNNAVCMEYADLLVTLLRASGIPAQVLEGYAFTEDKETQPVIGDVLHSWVRYYDPRLGWVSVDPTWGATSKLDYFTRLDTNHLILAIKGLSSLSPYPAGAYKINPNQTGDIRISLLSEIPTQARREIRMGLVEGGYDLLIENYGEEEIFDGQASLFVSGNGEPPLEQRLGNLPPFGKKTLRFEKAVMATPLSAGMPWVKLSYLNFDGQLKILRWSPDDKPKLYQPARRRLLFAVGTLSGLCLLSFYLLAKPRSSRRR